MKIWDETIKEDGTSSIQIHELRPVSTGCKPDEHYFVFTGGKTREAICRECKMVSSFILGYNKIVDGKIVKM